MYGLVTGYSIRGEGAVLYVRHEAKALKVRLTEPPNVIVVDRLNYALQTGATMNVAILNAMELLEQQNQVIVACGKSRSGLPSSVTSRILTVPFRPDEQVPLIRPDTLPIVQVRRQHIVDYETTGRGNTPADVFADSSLTTTVTATTRTNPTNNVDAELSDSDEETKRDLPPPHVEDDNAVLLQNRPLRKRTRGSDVPMDPNEFELPDDIGVPVFDTRADVNGSSFRPSP